MRSDIRKLSRCSFLMAFALAFALGAMKPSLCHADKLKDLQNLRDDASRLVNRSRGLAVAILKEIKSLDEACRGDGGEPIQDKKPLARQILGRIEPLTQSFDNNARSAEKSIDKFISHGYVDTLRLFDSQPGQYTWWDLKTRARERNVGWRIDYFLVSENFRKNVKSAYILPQVMGSDHCPIGIDLVI